MRKLNEIFDIIFNYLPGYAFGLLTFSIGMLGAILAILLSPEYIMWEKSISVLGHQTGGIYLRIGFIISGLIAIPFFVYLGRKLKHEAVNEYLRKVAVFVGVFSMLSVTFSGVFSGVNELISNLHGMFALFGWLSGTAFCFLFSIIMLKNPNFTKIQAYIGFLITGIFIYYLVPFFITNFCNYFASICYDFGRKVYVIMPISEWMVYFSTLIWFLFNSSYILLKKI
jgi:hypothetical protein